MGKLESILGRKGETSLRPETVPAPFHLYGERDDEGGVIISYNKMGKPIDAP